MHKINHIVFWGIWLLAMLSFNHGSAQSDNTNVLAKDGIIQLTNLDSKEIALDGQWHFYPQKLLSPSYFNKQHPEPYLYTLPQIWNSHTKPDGSKFQTKSFGTYRLKVSTDKKYEILALRIGRVETAYAIWIGNKKIFENGKVGTNFDESVPKWKGTVISFVPPAQEFYITLQVSNFHHKKGGLANSIYIAENEIARHSFFATIWRDLVLIGVLLIMAMYHFGLFFLRTKDKTTLYFGFVALFTGINILSTGQMLINHLFNDFPFEAIVKMNHVTNYLRIVPLLMFLGESFKDEIKPKFVTANIWWGAFWTIFILVTPARIFSEVLYAFFLQAGIIIIFATYWLVVAVRNKRDGALQSFIGILFIFITAANDMMHDAGIIRTGYLVPYGVFAFVFFQAYMLSLRSALSYRAVEDLSSRMMTLNNIKNKFLETTSYELSLSLKILVDSFSAKKGFTFLKQNGQWKLIAKVDKDTQKDYENVLLSSVSENEVPRSIIQHVIDSEKRLFFNFDNKDERFFNDPYIKQSNISSLVCMPLADKQDVRAVICLENDDAKHPLDESNLEILEIMSSQLLTTLENAVMYRELEIFNQTLEQQVEDRTQQIKQQNEEIATQRDEIESKSKVLEKAYDEITKKNQDITDSINYSKRIQLAILPRIDYIKTLVTDSFVMFKPRDVLSGDFYWFTDVDIEKDGIISKYMFAAAVDCTGHGVPGALMSIIGNNLLNYATKELHLTKPNEILDVMQDEIKDRLNQQAADSESKDGMDLSLIAYEFNTRTLCFSGARNPLVTVLDGKAQLHKATPMSIGGTAHARKAGKKFEAEHIEMKPGAMAYLFTDGYLDQFGGNHGRKFMKKKFLALTENIAHLPMDEQRQILDETITNWQGTDYPQVDDILVLGFRF